MRCSLPDRSRSCTTPAASSRSPRISANRAPGAVGVAQLRLQRPPPERHRRADPRRPQLRRQRRRARARGRAQRHDQRRRPGRIRRCAKPCDRRSFAIRSMPMPEADARRRLAADRLDQPVVAAARQQRHLRPRPRRHDLEHRVRVVVEAPHQPRLAPHGDAQRREMRQHRPRRSRATPAAGGPRSTARPPGTGCSPRACSRAGAAARGRSGRGSRRTSHPDAARSAPAAEARTRAGPPTSPMLLNSSVRSRSPSSCVIRQPTAITSASSAASRTPDRLHPELRVLPVATRLRPLVAEDRQHVEQLHRLRRVRHPMLDVGPADRRRPLGPQRQPLAAPVLEDVHLLLDDVGAVAHPAHEQIRLLERGRLEGAVSRGGSRRPRQRHNPVPRRRIGRQHIVRPAWRPKLHRAPPRPRRPRLHPTNAPRARGSAAPFPLRSPLSIASDGEGVRG